MAVFNAVNRPPSSSSSSSSSTEEVSEFASSMSSTPSTHLGTQLDGGMLHSLAANGEAEGEHQGLELELGDTAMDEGARSRELQVRSVGIRWDPLGSVGSVINERIPIH